MFETLSDRLSGVFGKLTRQGALTDDDIATAMREVRTALLEADVSLPVARSFVQSVTDRARGQAVTVTASRSWDALGGSVLRRPMIGPSTVRLSAAAPSLVVVAAVPSRRK